MNQLKDKNSGTYAGLELHGVDDALEKRQVATGADAPELLHGMTVADNSDMALAED